MAIRYRWLDGNGDASDPRDDSCGYCGAPPHAQDPHWTDDLVAEENQCPCCGATGLAPLPTAADRQKGKLEMTEARINKVANVLVQAVEVVVNPGAAAEQGLVGAARGLDKEAAQTLTHLAKALLTLHGTEEGEGDDAQD